MLRMFSIWPLGVVEGSGWMCAISATLVVGIVIVLFATGGNFARRRERNRCCTGDRRAASQQHG